MFSHDEEITADQVELKFLHYKCGFWEFPKTDDSTIVNTEFVFMGPCSPATTTKQGYTFKEDERAHELYKHLKSQK